ncbi:MAG TPA: hypothetical protein PKA77_13835 [Chitinophagaceae bacterium]|jgi:hypothetical protein|nr:hypothetical protein [Chitinophagaceae bacterium]HMU58095.1 hypothetical protein [Chitinophagaceae bacterium]
MRTATKTVVIVGIIIVGLILMGLNMGLRESSGHKTPGPLGIVLVVGIIAAIRAVSKYKPEEETKKDVTADSQTLDKR